MTLKERIFTARTFLACADACVVALIAFMLAAGFARPAYAYVDPSVMTYTIQALAGVAVALSAVLGVVWRRLRRFFLKVLKIDENAGKEVDPTAHELDPSAPDYAQRIEAANEAARRMRTSLATEKPEKLGWGARFMFALAASLMLMFTVVVAAPLEIVATSSRSLFFTVPDVWMPLAVTGGVAAVALALLMSCLRGRAFGVAFAVVSVFGICCYIQAMFLNTSLPPADGSQIDWGGYAGSMVFSAAVWIVLLAAGIVLSIKKSLLFKGLVTTLCFVGVVAQAIGLGVLLTTPADDGYAPIDARPTVTMDGVSEVSTKDNVIVFVLDTFDTRFLRDCYQEDPSCFDGFTGFTWFDNSTGSMIPTRYALSTLLTGKSLSESDPSYSTSTIIDWYTQHNLLDDINDLGYQTDLYVTDVYDAIGPLSEKAHNIQPLERTTDPVAGTAMLVKCALYRDLPWALKPLFWFYTDEVNSAVLVEDPDNLAGSIWNMDDAGYYELLQKQGLTASDIGDAGSFRVIHMAGTHQPYNLDRTGSFIEAGTSCTEQGLGALHIVDEYLSELKRLGLYDEATIVITADHGAWYLSDINDGPTNPILLVKPSTAEGGSSAPLQISSVPTGHVDFAATLLTAMGGDASMYGGMNVFDVPAQDRVRYFAWTSVVGADNTYTAIKQWKIDGEANTWENWEATGKEWPIE